MESPEAVDMQEVNRCFLCVKSLFPWRICNFCVYFNYHRLSSLISLNADEVVQSPPNSTHFNIAVLFLNFLPSA